MKIRTHNEWFRTVSLKNRKSCPTCNAKLKPGQSVWSWGEYISTRWRTVKHFCENCFEKEVKIPLVNHTDDCKCKIELQVSNPPTWLTLGT